MYLYFLFFCDIINIRVSGSLRKQTGGTFMFDYAIKLITENIKRLEANNQTETEMYLGVSNICESIRDTLTELGWRALYVEQGIFQLVRL